MLNTDRLETVLDLLHTARPKKQEAFTLDVFHGAEPILPGLLVDDFTSAKLNVVPSRHPEPHASVVIDYSCLSRSTSSSDGFMASRVKSLSKRQAASLGLPRGPAVTHQMVFVDGNGRWQSIRSGLVVWRFLDGEWQTKGRDQGLEGALRMLIKVAYARTLDRALDWRVVIAEKGAPGLSFVTDPEGARAAFRLRDSAPGRSRRSALLHWVAEHHRQTSGSGVQVRAHLRGIQSFQWNDLSVEIFPSIADAEAAQATGRAIKVSEPGTT